MSSTTEREIIARLNRRDPTAVGDIIAWLKGNRPHSWAIDRIEKGCGYDQNDIDVRCDLIVRWGLNACPVCACPRSEVRNFDPVWRDGDVCCVECGHEIRGFDAG